MGLFGGGGTTPRSLFLENPLLKSVVNVKNRQMNKLETFSEKIKRKVGRTLRGEGSHYNIIILNTYERKKEPVDGRKITPKQ